MNKRIISFSPISGHASNFHFQSDHGWRPEAVGAHNPLPGGDPRGTSDLAPGATDVVRQAEFRLPEGLKERAVRLEVRHQTAEELPVPWVNPEVSSLTGTLVLRLQ